MRRRKRELSKPITEGWVVALRQELADPATRVDAAVEIGDWARDLCLVMGASIDTAFAVGGLLAEGAAKTWREDVA